MSWHRATANRERSPRWVREFEELELRVARLEKWLDAIKEQADRRPSPAIEEPSELSAAKRIHRIEQALISNFNVDVTQ